jgi:hypothetical protein
MLQVPEMSLALGRRLFDRAPGVLLNRITLDRRYDRLAEHTAKRGNYSEAETMLLEREKLWPHDAQRLGKIAKGFAELAGLAAKAWPEPTPTQKAEIQGYLDHSARVGKEALHTEPNGASQNRFEMPE